MNQEDVRFIKEEKGKPSARLPDKPLNVPQEIKVNSLAW